MPTTTDEIEGEGEDKEGEDVTRPDKVKASLKSKVQDYLKDYREVFRPYLALSGGNLFLNEVMEIFKLIRKINL